MRKLIFALPALFLLASCGGSSNDNAKTTSEQTAAEQKGETLTLDTVGTKVDWKATHKGGLAPRWGKISVTSGTVSVNKDSLSGGEFTINLASLYVDPASVTEKDKKSTDLAGHLKSPDFFDVAKFPTAKFVITKVEPFTGAQPSSLLTDPNYLISGNLTLKDSTLNITFPSKVAIAGSDVTATAKFIIDRSAWGINYKAEGSPENWMISKDVEIGLTLKAKKN
ncbi:MAG: YceI family protein [Pedobacter agri]|uniref:YceI family protein n=1 Tax=Pedobacter agri TaxID=454586 RepID=A0A9X3DIG4_9SPHI|nr:YceI family protein [Pedobacter agri]MCX3266745.1 YceI family protein [Pedobacter agri]MDQ1139645.1 polyisoprenoid-binding protein YceI [Pedobacter agri]